MSGRKATGPSGTAELPNVVTIRHQDFVVEGPDGTHVPPRSVILGRKSSFLFLPDPLRARLAGLGGVYRTSASREGPSPYTTMTMSLRHPLSATRTTTRMTGSSNPASLPSRSLEERERSEWGPRAREEGGGRHAAPWGQSALGLLEEEMHAAKEWGHLRACYPETRLAERSQGGVSRRNG